MTANLAVQPVTSSPSAPAPPRPRDAGAFSCGRPVYQVLQQYRDHYIVWDSSDSLDKARESANKLWLRHMGREAMICA